MARSLKSARVGDLQFDITVAPLSDVTQAWQRTDLRGSRLMIVPDRILDARTRS